MLVGTCGALSFAVLVVVVEVVEVEVEDLISLSCAARQHRGAGGRKGGIQIRNVLLMLLSFP